MSNFFEKSDITRNESEKIISDTLKDCDDGELYLENSKSEFIMHYARQDLMWLKYHLKIAPQKIFCTKLASKIARTASSNHGYKDLVKEICGKDISKKDCEYFLLSISKILEK